MSATVVLLPGLDGTDVFLRPLVAALSLAIRPVVVTYPASGAEEYGDALEVVRRATWRIARRVPIWRLRSRLDPRRLAKAETLRAVPARCFAGRTRAVIDIDVSAALRQCRQPILCISFERDMVVPRKNADAILREAPSTTHATVAGGHFTGCVNSEALAAEIEAFVARPEAGRPGASG